MSRGERLYSALVRRDREAEGQLPAEVRRDLAPNGLRLILANALQSSGDQLVNASTVLPWLFTVLGVPPALTGVLVPVRESGSMLPQAFLTPVVLRVRYRRWVFVAGALVQAAAVAAMAATAAVGNGLAAGLVVVAALAVFALGRCLCSIASKDVQGRTIAKGERGQVNGLATTAAGLVAITLGLAVRLLDGEGLSSDGLAWLLAGGAALWCAVALVYRGVREPAGETTTRLSDAGEAGTAGTGTGTADAAAAPAGGADGWFAHMVRLLREDAPFRRFVGVRSLLLVSSLSPPFIVTLSVQSGASGLAGLGGYVIASGLAALIGGRLFGRYADRASNRLMSVGAGAASGVVIVTVAVVTLAGPIGESRLGTLVLVVAYFLLTLLHTGVRIGRKTYVVDMAEGDLRTVYVAVSNSAMGVMLLVVGAISSMLAVIDLVWALLFLAAMGLVGVVAAARLPDVSR